MEVVSICKKFRYAKYHVCGSILKFTKKDMHGSLYPTVSCPVCGEELVRIRSIGSLMANLKYNTSKNK